MHISGAHALLGQRVALHLRRWKYVSKSKKVANWRSRFLPLVLISQAVLRQPRHVPRISQTDWGRG